MKNKLWTVYQVENRVNSRLYIGVHKTVDPNDDYMGSGKLIKRAIQKHGIDNFKKVILLATEDKDEAYSLEKELVTLDRIESGELYNLKEGGEGGWDFANKVIDRSKCTKLGGLAVKLLFETNPEWRAETSRKISEGLAVSNSFRLGVRNFLGKKHTDKTKEKISVAMQGKQLNEKNSQFGIRRQWITNGVSNKKIKKIDKIPIGWKPGITKLQCSL